MAGPAYFEIPWWIWTNVFRCAGKGRFHQSCRELTRENTVVDFSGCLAKCKSSIAQSTFFCNRSANSFRKTHDRRITSYINNLHPSENKDLYKIIENIIDKAIPLWNAALTPLIARCPLRITYEISERDPDSHPIPEDQMPRQGLIDGESDFEEDDDDFIDREAKFVADWGYAYQKVLQPEPGEFTTSASSWYLKHYYEEGILDRKADGNVDLRRDFGNRGLQIIVKLANIQLTPEKPHYDGGSWHVEG